MLINLHTHRQPEQGEKAILNLYENFRAAAAPGYYSIGVHPWYIQESWLRQFKEVKEYSPLDTVVAIGETGLDKLCKTDWSKQALSFTPRARAAWRGRTGRRRTCRSGAARSRRRTPRTAAG